MSRSSSLFSRLTTVLLVSLLMVPVAAVSYTNNAAAATCPKYEFIGARGSGQSPRDASADYSKDSNLGMGTEIHTLFSALDKALPGQLSPYGAHYEATSIWPGGFKDLGSLVNGAGALLHIGLLGDYQASVTGGIADVKHEVDTTFGACKGSTKFILAGYSQGAQAVGDAIQKKLSADELAQVAAVALFGDPEFNADSASAQADFDPNRYGILNVRDEWPASLAGKILSYCHPHDPICGMSRRIRVAGEDIYYRDPFGIDKNQHENYPAKSIPDAASKVAASLGVVTTPPTNTAPLDLVFAIDSTGSMGSTIASVENNVSTLAQTIASTSSNYRFALVDYKDDPANDSSYQSRVDIGFTQDVTAFSSAVSSITAQGGGDTPESVYSGVMTALGLPWRNGVRKAVIAIGDAPGKDPEPVTGNTIETVRTKALAVDPAQVYAVEVGTAADAQSFFSTLADKTGGKFLQAPDTDTFVSTLKSAIVAVGAAPQADLGGPYSGFAGTPLNLSAAATIDPAEPVVGYDWDFNGDGVYDRTTTTPVVSYTYPTAGTYTAVVRARSQSGLSATATAQVSISTAATSVPGTPAKLTASAGDQQVTLNWDAPSAGPVRFYTIRDDKGTVIDRLGVNSGGTPTEWVDGGLTNGTTYSYTVSAGNEQGEGKAAGPASATPQAPATSTTPTPTTGTTATSASPTSSSAATPASTTGTSQAPTPQGLSFTGVNIVPLLIGGLTVLLVGAAIVFFTRRRRRTSR